MVLSCTDHVTESVLWRQHDDHPKDDHPDGPAGPLEAEFGDRQNDREMDPLDQMTVAVAWPVGKRLRYRDLIEPNELPSGARS